jgi:hypothetical protein
MSQKTRQQKLAAYAGAYDELVAALQRCPRAMWQFRPAPDGWTIHETIIHITDSEANSFVRCRRLIAEPGSAVMGYDENVWARRLNYHAQSTDDALELFRWLRHASHALVAAQPDSVWSHTIHHSEDGTMTMDDWLDTYARHVIDHIAQMQATYEAWAAQPTQ